MQKGPGVGVEPVGLLPPVSLHHLVDDMNHSQRCSAYNVESVSFRSRIAMTLLVSVVFTACGGGLTDAETVWCKESTQIGGRGPVSSAARSLGLDYDSPARGEAPTSEYVRACKAAYESR